MKLVITTGRDCGSAKWITLYVFSRRNVRKSRVISIILEEVSEEENEDEEATDEHDEDNKSEEENIDKPDGNVMAVSFAEEFVRIF